MHKVQLTYRFRLYPKPEQERRLLGTMELRRQAYNHFLARWREGVPSRFELQAQLPKLKLEKPELNEVYSKTP